MWRTADCQVPGSCQGPLLSACSMKPLGLMDFGLVTSSRLECAQQAEHTKCARDSRCLCCCKVVGPSHHYSGREQSLPTNQVGMFSACGSAAFAPLPPWACMLLNVQPGTAALMSCLAASTSWHQPAGGAMSSIAEELDVTSEANLLFIGLLLAKGPPHPDAPEHANVRTAFAALHTWVCCPALSHRLCFKPAVALPSLGSGQPNGDPAACSGFTIAASMRRCCLTPSVRQPTSSAVGSFNVERRLH